MAKMLLLGLDEVLAGDLTRVLRQLGHSVSKASGSDSTLETDADLIFTGSGELPGALAFVPHRPVIVASRLPDMNSWISALEAGAADYCGAPFEPTQVRWVLNSALAA